MKKLKQFYTNNEKTILLCSGVVLGSLVTVRIANQAIEGLSLVNAEVYVIQDTAQKILRVTFKNGSVRDYLWHVTDIPTM